MDQQVARDDTALSMLQHIAAAAGSEDQPLVLTFDPAAVTCFNSFLEGLHARAGDSEGLEAGWLGKGKGTMARLAGALTLLAWSENWQQGRPGLVTEQTAQATIELWSGYFHPHARTVFNRAGRTDRDRHARRVVKWLRLNRMEAVGREDIRRRALAEAVSAEQADAVIERLQRAGMLRFGSSTSTPRGGSPVRRWLVNPGLHER